jgi:cell wall-associated NlpC family hydrolase
MWRNLCKIAVTTMVFAVMAIPAGAYQNGDQGTQILLIQQKLRKYGYPITVDGVYGKETVRAVQRFQADKGLSINGVVDSKTYYKLVGKKIPFINEDQQHFTHFAPQDWGNKLVASANQYVGVPYVFGGNTPKGFDCSGFTCYVFRGAGVQLPRMADEQYRIGSPIAKSNLQPGDLVFFTTYEPGVSHAGIYVGNGNFISATSSSGVRVDSLSSSYWASRYVGAKRVH